MNKIINLHKSFQENIISKKEYIDEIYQIHDLLYQYAEWLPKTDIKGITILEGDVNMILRDSDLSFKCLRGDKRLATLDILNFKTYEKAELNLQLELINENAVVLDIGANYGWYALQIAFFRPKSKIFSFEPVPETFQTFVHNIIENNISNVIPYNMGFSDKEQLLDFYIDKALYVNASIKNVSESENAQKITCITKTLDQFVANRNIAVDFIKCDVEGAELLVFKGGRKLFKENRPIVFTEMLRKWSAKFDYHPNDIISFFKELGYNCYTITKNEKLRLITQVTDRTIETNFFFMHEVKHQCEIAKCT